MNKLLYNQYKLKKASVLQNATYPQIERTLYHGTSESSVKEICVHGFNRSFCGKNGTLAFFVLFTSGFVTSSDVLVSPRSHRLRSGGLFCCELGSICPGSVFPAKRGWIQVYFCVQSSNGRLHQRLPFDKDGPAEGDRRYPPQIRQRD